MLGLWLTHDEYRKFLVGKLVYFATLNLYALYEYESIISKLYVLNLDPLKKSIKNQYSSTGRPSKHQAELFRSFIIIHYLQIALYEWIEKLEHSSFFRNSGNSVPGTITLSIHLFCKMLLKVMKAVNFFIRSLYEF